MLNNSISILNTQNQQDETLIKNKFNIDDFLTQKINEITKCEYRYEKYDLYNNAILWAEFLCKKKIISDEDKINFNIKIKNFYDANVN